MYTKVMRMKYEVKCCCVCLIQNKTPTVSQSPWNGIKIKISPFGLWLFNLLSLSTYPVSTVKIYDVNNPMPTNLYENYSNYYQNIFWLAPSSYSSVCEQLYQSIFARYIRCKKKTNSSWGEHEWPQRISFGTSKFEI